MQNGAGLLVLIINILLNLKNRGGTTSVCLPNYEGPLCDVCVLNSEKKSYKLANTCQNCPSTLNSILYNLGYFFISLAFTLFTIR